MFSIKRIILLHLHLKHWSINLFCTMSLKTTNDGLEGFLSDSHLFWFIVTRSLQRSDVGINIKKATVVQKKCTENQSERRILL